MVGDLHRRHSRGVLGRSPEGFKTLNGCPTKNFWHDRQDQMKIHSIIRLLTKASSGSEFLQSLCIKISSKVIEEFIKITFEDLLKLVQR